MDETVATDALPRWAPRVPQEKVRRLYETDARGVYDDELIDDVGYTLLLRCESFVDVVEARRGRVRCPRCKAVVEFSGGRDELVRCACGWELTWGAYFSTIKGAQLSGAEPVLELFGAFISQFKTARDARQKMLAIDRLIHGFHYSHKDGSRTRPVAVNLIEGKLRQVVAFLDQLSCGDQSSPGVEANRTAWRGHIAGHDWDTTRKGEADV